MVESGHKAGFVSIIGKPNVGKSTLMNKLVGERLSIITSKAQTTRHRIMGILSSDNFQIIYSDTPGMLKPAYQLQSSMMNFVNSALEDADIILLVTDFFDNYEEKLLEKLKRLSMPIILVLNKVDLDKGGQTLRKIEEWKSKLDFAEIIPTSAIKGKGIEKVFETILELLPIHPAFFPKDTLTDKPEKFFASEIIREKIFMHYKQEVPYSTEVEIETFEESEEIIHIRALIYVERKSQKGIIIGKKGEALKRIGTEARIDMETFFGKKVFLETYVKVADDWRKKERMLKEFGYKNK